MFALLANNRLYFLIRNWCLEMLHTTYAGLDNVWNNTGMMEIITRYLVFLRKEVQVRLLDNYKC